MIRRSKPSLFREPHTQDLPYDILPPILAQLSDRRDWHACALVSKVFNRAATPLLYRTLDSRVVSKVSMLVLDVSLHGRLSTLVLHSTRCESEGTFCILSGIKPFAQARLSQASSGDSLHSQPTRPMIQRSFVFCSSSRLFTTLLLHSSKGLTLHNTFAMLQKLVSS